MGYKEHCNQNGVAKGFIRYRFDFRSGGKRHRKIVICRKTAVHAIYTDWENQILRGVTGRYLLFEIVDKYLDHEKKRVDTGDLSKEFNRNSIQRLKAFCEWCGNVEVDCINSEKIKDFQLHLKSTGLKNGTVTAYTTIIRMFFKYAVKRGYYHQYDNPASCQTPKPDPVRQIELTENQVQEILHKSAEYNSTLHTAVRLALFAGLRRGECFGLTWNDVDFENNIINIRAETTKTDTARQVPLCSELKDHLLHVRKNTRSVRILKYNGKKRISVWWGNFREQLTCSVVNGLDLRFHDLRHVFGLRCLENGIDIYDVSQWLGHTTVKMTQRYYCNVQRRCNFNQIDRININSSKKVNPMVNDNFTPHLEQITGD